MEITFLGVGEAFDEAIPNTSVLVRTEIEGKVVTLLLDCGYSVPPRFWKLGLHPDTLDGIWISHFHADHGFGVPPLLVRFWEEKRNRDLCFLGQKGVDSYVQRCLDLGYPHFLPRLTYPLKFEEIEPKEPKMALGLTWNTAVSDHPQRNLALRLKTDGKSLFYSGDGRPTSETIALAQGVDLIVHEAFDLSENISGHGTITACLEMARATRAKRLALVHIQRNVRREKFQEIKELAKFVQDLEVLIPEPGDVVTI
jgi:ribonuclease BN (tRNA processing enzyme)